MLKKPLLINQRILKTFCRFKSELVTLNFSDLKDSNRNLNADIEKAFGTKGLGILTIKGIPRLAELRKNLLKKAYILANLSPQILKTLERPESMYTVGWSKGISSPEGKKDSLLGSFYAHVKSDYNEYPEDKQFELANRNVWLNENIYPELVGFKQNFLELGNLIYDSSELIFSHLDKYCYEKLPSKIKKNLFVDSFSKGNYSTQARLITYYPYNYLTPEETLDKHSNTWIGWHRDFGIITNLMHPLFINSKGEEVKGIPSLITIKDREGQIQNVEFNDDEMAIQIGDAAFLMSGGCLNSTPHKVMIHENTPKDVFRLTFIGFLEPKRSFIVNVPDKMTVKSIVNSDPNKLEDSLTEFQSGEDYMEFSRIAYLKYFK